MTLLQQLQYPVVRGIWNSKAAVRRTGLGITLGVVLIPIGIPGLAAYPEKPIRIVIQIGRAHV